MVRNIDIISIGKRAFFPILGLFIVVVGIGALYSSWLFSLYDLSSRAPREGDLLILLAVGIAVLLIHELIHAISYSLFGCRPKFGVETFAKILPIGLTTSAVGCSLRVYQMIIVGLMPLAIITAVATIVAAFPSVAIYALSGLMINLVGSSADIYILYRLLPHSRSSDRLVRENGKDFVVYTRS